MNKFRIGQRVVCTGKNGWMFEHTFSGFWFWKENKKAIGPVCGETVTVLMYASPGHMNISGYVGNFDDKYFQPVQENVSVIELLNKELCLN